MAASVAGLLGQAAGDTGSHEVQAWVVRGEPCAGANGMEIIRFSVDGREHVGMLDGCGHQRDEPVLVRVGSSADVPVGHAAAAAAGQGRYGRRLGELLLVLACVAAAGYALLLRRGPRGRPQPLLGPVEPPDLGRLADRLSRRS